MKPYRYATHKEYCGRIFWVTIFSDGNLHLGHYHQKESHRSKKYSCWIRKKGKKVLILGGHCSAEGVKLHKRIPRKIKKKLMR